jgi:primosomal protein N' (replication factor Y)
MFADVLFPLKAIPFTYSVPDGMATDLSGRVVTVSLGGREARGLVVAVHSSPPPHGSKTKPLLGVHGRFASAAMLGFLNWLADYYLAPPGLALKSLFFAEAIAPLTPRKRARRALKQSEEHAAVPLPPLPEGWSVDSARLIPPGKYGAFVWQGPDISQQQAGAVALSERAGASAPGIIILAPEIRTVISLAPHFARIFGERFVALHGKLTRRAAEDAVSRILSGSADIILGARSAILAPLPACSMIIVLEEHSQSYKAEELLRYNARDVAVMRGYLERCPVLLCSATPSLETVHNSRNGKYRMLDLPLPETARRPSIKVIRAPFNQLLAREAINEAKSALRNRRNLLVLAGRKGYGVIGCADCGALLACPACNTASVYHRSTASVRCHHCGRERPVPDACDACGGHALTPFSMGTERVQEELNALFGSVEDTRNATAGQDDALPIGEQGVTDFSPFVIGAGRGVSGADRFSAALLLNIDLLLGRADFRAYERLFQEVMSVAGMVEPGGTILLQTASPAAPIMRFIRKYDYAGFCEWELGQRSALGHPPFRRMIAVSVFMEKDSDKLRREVEQRIAAIRIRGVDILGPIAIPSSSQRYQSALQTLLASQQGSAIREAARGILHALEKMKEIRVVVDVDPLTV